MNIESALHTVLTSSTLLAAEVGTRIYSNMADQLTEQSAAPYIVVIMDDRVTEQSKGGGGIITASFLTDIYHEQISEGITISEIISSILQDYEGTHDDLTIQEIWHINTTMARNEATQKHVYRMEWMVRFYK